MSKMKKIIFILFFLISLSNLSFGQKFGYIDSDYILKKMPEYKEAQADINKISMAWHDEIQNMQKIIEGMYNSYKAEEVLLTKEMKEERLAEISKKENDVKEYQKKVFGVEGLYFLKKQELIKPVQDKVFEAVQKVAKKKRLHFVFDKAGDIVMIYTDPIHDYTDYVLEELGLGDENDVIK
jgi:outer membrane protein